MNPLYFLPFLLTVALAELVLYEAGATPIQRDTIADGATICLTGFANGISIKCTNLPGAVYANFSVNGKQVREENSRPYFIAGDKKVRGFVNPWAAPLGQTVDISCLASNGLSHTATVTFSCKSEPNSGRTPEPPTIIDKLKPSTMVFVEAGQKGDIGPVLKNGLTFCPHTFPSGQYSIFCKESPGSMKARFFVNGVRTKTDRAVPYHINRDFKGRVRPWVAPEGFFQVECRIGKGVKSKVRVRVFCGPKPKPKPKPVVKTKPKPVVKTNPMIKTKQDGCIVIDSRLSLLSAGWKETNDGVIFREGDLDKGIEGKGKFPLTYKFTPPVTSHYAVVIDMTTMNSKDYNDIWIKVDGEFNLIRKGVVKPDEGDGWIKGYHNLDGRGSLISSIDFDAHSISTRAILQAGVEYTFGISGRSTQVEVHDIILFPCGVGESVCQRGDQTWKDFMVSCAGA